MASKYFDIKNYPNVPKKNAEKQNFFLFTPNHDHYAANFFRKEKMICPTCHNGWMNQREDKFIRQCDNRDCGAKLLDVVLSDVQLKEITGNYTWIYKVGGAGTGKTMSSALAIFLHLKTVPGALVIVVSNTKLQLLGTAQMELLKFFLEDDFVNNWIKGKPPNDVWRLRGRNNTINTIMWYTSDSYAKVKSFNASAIWVVEAEKFSDPQFFLELFARLRLESALVFAKDHHGNLLTQKINGKWEKKVVESNLLMIWEQNPGYCLPIMQFFPTIKDVYFTPSVIADGYFDVANDYYKKYPTQNQQENSALFVESSYDSSRINNTYLESLKRSKTPVEAERDLKCALHDVRDLVYPEFHKCIITIEEYNKIIESYKYDKKKMEYNLMQGVSDNDFHWVSIAFLDFGGRYSCSAMVVFLYNRERDIFVQVEEIFKPNIMINEMVGFLTTAKIKWGEFLLIIADPQARNTTHGLDNKTYFDLYYERGFALTIGEKNCKIYTAEFNMFLEQQRVLFCEIFQNTISQCQRHYWITSKYNPEKKSFPSETTHRQDLVEAIGRGFGTIRYVEHAQQLEKIWQRSIINPENRNKPKINFIVPPQWKW